VLFQKTQHRYGEKYHNEDLSEDLCEEKRKGKPTQTNLHNSRTALHHRRRGHGTTAENITMNNEAETTNRERAPKPKTQWL
jgi:hypothetical protein